jgi:hypothetical protein
MLEGRPRDVVQVQARVDSGPLRQPPQRRRLGQRQLFCISTNILLLIIPRFAPIFQLLLEEDPIRICVVLPIGDSTAVGGSSSVNHEHTGTTLKDCFLQQQNRLLYDNFLGLHTMPPAQKTNSKPLLQVLMISALPREVMCFRTFA